MFGIITAVVIFLALVALTQVIKIYETSSAINEGKDNEVSTKDNNNQGTLMLIFGVVFMIAFFAMLATWGKNLLPQPASEHGADYDNLMNISMYLIIAVFAIVQPILFYFAFKYRGKKGTKAVYYEHNNKLEFIWTIVPAVALAVLIIYGLTTWINVTNPSKDKEPIVIELYAQQFKWTARYAGADNELGYANVRMIGAGNALGVDTTSAYGNDDVIVGGDIHLPKGRPVLFKFRSQDVIHSAYMPHFRAQMNCVPGMTTQFQFTPVLTTKEIQADPQVVEKVARINALRAAEGKEAYEYNYLLLCNKICGAAHYNMQLNIIVEEEAEFQAWMKEQKTFAESK